MCVLNTESSGNDFCPLNIESRARELHVQHYCKSTDVKGQFRIVLLKPSAESHVVRDFEEGAAEMGTLPQWSGVGAGLFRQPSDVSKNTNTQRTKTLHWPNTNMYRP